MSTGLGRVTTYNIWKMVRQPWRQPCIFCNWAAEICLDSLKRTASLLLKNVGLSGVGSAVGFAGVQTLVGSAEFSGWNLDSTGNILIPIKTTRILWKVRDPVFLNVAQLVGIVRLPHFGDQIMQQGISRKRYWVGVIFHDHHFFLEGCWILRM